MPIKPCSQRAETKNGDTAFPWATMRTAMTFLLEHVITQALRFRRVCAIILSLLVLHAAALLITGRQVQIRVDELHRQGHPVCIKDLIPSPVPESLNGAIVYEPILRLVEASVTNEDERSLSSLITDRESPTDDARSWARCAKILGRYPDLCARVARAEACPYCVFPTHSESLLLGAEETPTYHGLRLLSRLLNSMALHQLHEGQAEAALHTLKMSIGLERALQAEPLLYPQFLRYEMIRTACRVLALAAMPEAASAPSGMELDDTLEHLDLKGWLSTALNSERASGIQIFQALRAGSPSADVLFSSPQYARLIGSIIWRPVLNYDEIQYLRSMDRAITDGRLFWTDPDADNIDPAQGAPVSAIVTWDLVPAFGPATGARDDCQAEINGSLDFLALLRFRQRAGSYPAALADLARSTGRSLPADPFSGRPFVYRREGRGFVLYSIGWNRRDDGGQSSLWLGRPSDHRADDIVWRRDA